MSDERPRHVTIRHPDGSTSVAGIRYADDSLRDDARAMLELLRRLESEVACTCSDTADAAECACDEGSAVDCGCVCHPLGALLGKHGRTP